MDIWFCDVCAARVTEDDFRRGQGIRKRYDVVCGTCIEQGHGADLLRSNEKVASAKPALVGAAAGGGDLHDRRATFDDETPAIGTPTNLPSDDDLSSAASGFSALSEEDESDDTLRDIDDDDDGYGAEDETAREVEIESDSAPDEQGDERDEDDHQPLDEQGGKAETVEIEQEDIPEAPEPGDRSAQRRSGRRGSSRRVRKSGKTSKSGRSAAASGTRSTRVSSRSTRHIKKGPSQNMVLAVSGVTLGILILLIIIVASTSGGDGGGGETGPIRPDKDLAERIAVTQREVVTALNGNDLAQLKAARRQLRSVQGQVYSFEKKAVEQGYNEEEIGRILRGMDFPELNMLIRSLNDKISQLEPF